MTINRALLNRIGLVLLGILTLLTVVGTFAAPIDGILKIAVVLVILVLGGLILNGIFPLIAGIALLIFNIVVFLAVNMGSIMAAGEGILGFIMDPNAHIAQATVINCYDDPTCGTVYPIVFSLILFIVILTGFAYTTLLERRVLSFLQQRIGPNRVGPKGFLQPAADGVKLIFKEDIIPAGVNLPVYLLAPVLKAVPILIVVAVIPLGSQILIPWFDNVWYSVPLGLADPNVGVLWILAITSLGTYGVVLAGWASDNKYAMLGGLRATAQMISYELSLGLALVVPIMLAGSLSVGDIINAQSGVPILSWFVFQNPLAAAILLIALLAETNRAPFDLPEAEQELTAGYMTEYSGMKFALFMMAEYLGMIAVSMIAAAMFFGGYHLVLVDEAPILGPLVMIGKVVLLLTGMIWIRATLPRIRYDRLMSFGWKVMLPLALISVIWTAVSMVIGDLYQSTTAYGVVSGIFFVVVMVGAILMLRKEGQDDEVEKAKRLDPMVTGERSGIGYVAMNIVGGLLAAPFVLYNALLKLLDRLAGLAPPEETALSGDAKGASESKTPAK